MDVEKMETSYDENEHSPNKKMKATETTMEKKFTYPSSDPSSFPSTMKTRSTTILSTASIIPSTTPHAKVDSFVGGKPNDAAAKAKKGFPMEKTCEKLRKLVLACWDNQQFRQASYFADKLTVMSKGALSDVWLLARTFYLNGEYRRATSSIQKYKALEREQDERQAPKFRHLSAQCLASCKQWEECLDMLEPVAPDDDAMVLEKASQFKFKSGESVNIMAAICLLKGLAYEALENRKRGSVWLQLALKCDVYCSEAFFQLIDKQLLSSEEEQSLLSSLNFEEGDEYLVQMYSSHLGKYDYNLSIARKFEKLETMFQLKDSLDIIATKAEALYYRRDTEQAYKLSKWVFDRDPYNPKSIEVYVSSLVELKKNSELFYCAHQLVDAYADRAVSWYAIGCYYYLIRKFDVAQRYFHKATSIDSNFAPAWIGFGNSFASQDESDQAMAAYRTASRLFPGSHFPLLCIGMEYLRTNNLILAAQFVGQAKGICPLDPSIFNELGSIEFKRGNYSLAVEYFEKAMSLCKTLPHYLMENWETTIFNLAHSYRKVGDDRNYNQAVARYHQCLGLCPRRASTHAALGFTLHLQGKLNEAIESYHTALGMKPEDTLATEMLSRALQEIFGTPKPSHLRSLAFSKQAATPQINILDESSAFDVSSIHDSAMNITANSSMHLESLDHDEDDEDDMSI